MNINNLEIKIENFALHYIGNSLRSENCIMARSLQNYDNRLESILKQYFLQSFKYDKLFNFNHEIKLDMNEVFSCISGIFNEPKTLLEQSINLAKHLYEKSNHPKIKSGEFYVVYLKNCMIDGKNHDAIGIFKSENKDIFLNIISQDDGFKIRDEEGVNIKKLDKGAIIFNCEQDEGYVVAVIDNANSGVEARYWVDDFLHVRQREDEYHNTQNIISLTKKFVSKELAKNPELSKADQADMINKTLNYLKSNEKFDFEEFADEVIVDGRLIDGFKRYKDQYANEHDIAFNDNFSISPSAVKKNVRSLKSVIKLDKNFLIHIQGDSSKLECGEDEKGKFYKMYYIEES